MSVGALCDHARQDGDNQWHAQKKVTRLFEGALSSIALAGIVGRGLQSVLR